MRNKIINVTGKKLKFSVKIYIFAHNIIAQKSPNIAKILNA